MTRLRVHPLTVVMLLVFCVDGSRFAAAQVPDDGGPGAGNQNASGNQRNPIVRRIPAVIREMTIINHGDGTAAAEVVLAGLQAVDRLFLGTTVTARDVLPTVVIEPDHVGGAASPATPSLTDTQARQAFRISPPALKDGVLNERLSRLVGQQISVSYAGTDKVEQKTGTLKSLQDPATPGDHTLTLVIAGADETIARDRIVSITSPAQDDRHALDILTTKGFDRVRYRRSVQPWSMSYRVDVGKVNTLRAAAVVHNPTPQRLENASLVLRQGEFVYELTGVNLPAERVGSIGYQRNNQFELDVQTRLHTQLVFDAAEGESGPAHEVIELVNDRPQGTHLVGGPMAIYRDQKFVGTHTLTDLFHKSRSGETIRPLDATFHLYPSQRLISLKAQSLVTVAIKQVPYRPTALQQSTLTVTPAYEVVVTNASTTGRAVIVKLPRKPVVATMQTPAVLTVAGRAADAKPVETKHAILLEDSKEMDVRRLSNRELTTLAGRAHVPRDLALALKRLVMLRTRISDNAKAQKARENQLAVLTLRVDALRRINDGSLRATSRLANAQQQLDRAEADLRAHALEADVAQSELAIFLAEVDVN